MRRAIIVECSAVAGQGNLPGAVVDAEAWLNYLLSSRGGAWESHEIEILSNPSRGGLLARIATMSGDYGFVTFSGHGSVSGQTTILNVQNAVVAEHELIPPSCSRVTLVLDSCRGFERALNVAKSQTLYDHVVDHSAYRRLFDSAVENAEYGSCRLYGCDFGQAAQENKDGGLFTQSMIRAGRSWSGRGVLPINQAFDSAVRTVKQQEPQQTPTSLMGRRIHHFPFAVEI